MRKPNDEIPTENIFLLLERYLTTPGESLKEHLNNLSHDLANQAYQEAERLYPDKNKIGADEYMPILREMIQKQAQEAYEYSTRLIQNEQVTDEDPEYLFKVTEKQKEVVKTLYEELMREKRRRPDGLIFAYHGYIERRKPLNPSLSRSQFDYCDEQDAVIYDRNAALYQKARHLHERGHPEAADVLFSVSHDIKAVCNEHKSFFKNKPDVITQIATILDTAKNEDAIKQHRGAKKMIVNFLLAMSVVGLIYLSATTKTRGTFWYRPATDSESKVEEFAEKLNEKNQAKH
ncbi:hypothetical protein [Legionella impletisoli]|uniref:Uncharacterized protein n=1 Tax=Legionella impletisoli TaxID=343510 RepID=A0A917JSH3_9GAMM|nr:hypothetical protein [Legionella impletisoli]GGI83994.1 hypothetical protein GCM10007966_10800 [Legionella impletisoli]